MRGHAQPSPGIGWFRILKGILMATIVTLVCIMAFALIIKMVDLPDSAIAPVNQGIKLLSIFIGAWVAVGNGGERGFLKGALMGLGYMIVGIVAFSLLEQRMSAPVVMLSDAGLGVIAGMLSGIIAANVRHAKTA